MDNNPHVSVVILNWNGWQDTIECLESVLKTDYDNFNIILIDNNSENESADKIIEWLDGNSKYDVKTKYPELVQPLEKKPIKYAVYNEIEDSFESLRHKQYKILFIKNSDNVGFAKASNQGIMIAQKVFSSKYHFLLNNDTVLEKHAMGFLVHELECDESAGAAQSTIFSYDDSKIIANAGGRLLFWGQTKYYKSIKRDEIKSISFINGCALCVRDDTIKKFGALSEKFFFGEEDFEFSYRLKKAGIKKICLGASKVYHKIGVSSEILMKQYEKRVFLFSLNRFVNLKYFYPKTIWHLWRILASLYFIALMHFSYKVPHRRAVFLMKRVNYYAMQINDVQRDTLYKIFNEINL